MTREAIILAGGSGSRLAAVVADRPKPLAEVAGRPFLAWQLDYLHSHGIRRVVLAIGFRGQQIVDAFGHRYRDIEVVYSLEASPLGTGGALCAALCRIEARGAFVLNGDTAARLDFAALQGRADESLVIAAVKIDDARRYGALAIDGEQVTGFAEKVASGAAFVNAGAYWVRRDLFDGFVLPERFSFEEHFLRPFVDRIRPRAVIVPGPMIDIGVPESLAAAQKIVPAVLDEGSADGLPASGGDCNAW
ncbi:MAG TPA: sugar phosphate nucleotidyltransferase [Casimicrobiaceae bacterium]